jgi:hypothetical protein
MTSTRQALSVVRYDEDKTALVRDCLLPLALELARAPGIERCYLERHWLFGPRVRLCARGRGLEAVRARVEAWVAAHPSRAALDVEKYLALSQTLGTRELVPPPYGPIDPDNRVVLEAHAPRADLLGGEEAVDYFEEYLTRAMVPLCAHLEAARRDPRARTDYLVRVMAILAASYHGGVVAGSLSYRSHLDGFLHEHDGDGRIVARFEREAARHQPAVTAAARAALADVHRGVYTGDEPVLRAWGELFRFGRERGLELARRRVITEDPGPLFRPVAERISAEALRPWLDYEGRTWSDFHQTLLDGATLPERVHTDVFSAYRWMVNMHYKLIMLLGVTPMERYYLNHLLCAAIEEITGVSWQDHLDAVAQKFAGRSAS